VYAARTLVLGLLATVLVGLPQARAEAAPADLVPPETITICRSSGAIETVALKDYVKVVLPREFPSTWPGEAIKAGAVAVKSYAWYYVEHPYRPGTCHISDTTKHQKYDPGDPYNQPTATSNAAVDLTWHWRLEENGRPAYAQYCNCSWFPQGRHIQQTEARNLAGQGWDHVRILAHSYRNLSGFRLLDWRMGFGLTYRGEQPYAVEDDADLRLVAAVAGVAPGDPDADVNLYARCTIAGNVGFHLVQTAGVTNPDGRPSAVFEDTARLRECQEEQFGLRVELKVNGNLLLSQDALAWKPWTSSVAREVERVAATNDPVVASIRLSDRVFADREVAAEAAEGSPAVTTVGQEEEAPSDTRRQARVVVLARSDQFPDSLAATPLAGADAPILLNPGGEGATLHGDVGTEIDRVLDAGDTVHLVGGPTALPEAIERELTDAGYLVQRHAGATRVETSIAVAEAVRDDGGDTSTVLLARAFGPGSAAWADAVASGPYAAATRHPILLTSDEGLAAEVEAWIEDAGNGVEEAVILGGPAAVPADAEKRLDVATSRVQGASRSFTAVAIAEQLWSREDAPEVTGAMLVDGYDAGDWPFALAAAVLAANEGTPQLLTRRLVPNHSTGEWLDGQPELAVVIVGGEAIVPPRIEGDAAGP